MLSKLISIWFLVLLSGCCSDADAKAAKSNLYSDKVSVRNEAALTLAGCGQRAHSAVPRLIELLSDENVGMQSSAAFALRKIDTPEARRSLERK